MAQSPEVQARCQEEVQQHLPDPDTPITWEVLDKLRFLELAIKETLRLTHHYSLISDDNVWFIKTYFIFATIYINMDWV